MAEINMKEMTGLELEKLLNEKGWKEVYQTLRKLHETLECKQAHLFGEPDLVNKANKMAPMLLKQDITLLVIEREAKAKGIDIGKIHR
jgi:hypothetical protein